ncbi:hypothetical protein [Dysgonomonas sp. 520]|uniref:hypothetical protein n=1 Tax=Dysgonomonas sp. 520 TaxID=2302931 RepID=UPI0013D407C0|nr:hypothetical protein [Dysgonomonas sp. 520]NDW11235.1 hypothetical protein [Dysgonomonas sp. 520]
MMKTHTHFSVLLAFSLICFMSCEKSLFLDNNDKNTDKYDDTIFCDEYDELISKLFRNGFSMKLEEIYLAVDDNKLSPIFGSTQSIYNIPNYRYDTNFQKMVLSNIEKGEVWNVSKMYEEKEQYQIEQGKYGEGAWATKVTRWNIITIQNTISGNQLITTFDNGMYTQYSWETKYGFAQIYGTNLKLSIFDFDGEFVKIITNDQYTMGRLYTVPLTSNQVKIEIERGNYEIVMVENNITAYKIGENFYVPTGIGNEYKYYGSTSANGMFNQLSQTNYILVFKVI